MRRIGLLSHPGCEHDGGMPERFAEVGDLTLCYETFGDPDDPTLLLIMGLGAQMIEWHTELCTQLAAEGFHVVRFDNRDAGLSSTIDVPVNIFEIATQAFAGQPVEVPYLLTDMAGDVVGLLDHLGVDRAHVVGASLGGMIAQTLTIARPERVLSLTSIMSTTGDPEVGQPHPEALQVLMSPPPQDRQQSQDRRVAANAVWGSPGLTSEQELRAWAGRAWDRRHDPYGVIRQLAAILAAGSRSDALRQLTVPTLVIHGTADKLIDPSGGDRTAEVVPGAKLVVVEGMGHDLARPLWPQLVDEIVDHARRAQAAPAATADAARRDPQL
jgi:pimeloyl-ACP methyl ester carboxylesterase